MGKILSAVMALTVAASSAITFAAPAEARRGDRYRGNDFQNYCYNYPRARECRDYRANNYRHYDDRRYHRRDRNRGNEAAAAIGGLVLGAIIGGVIANSERRSDERRYYRGDSHQERCARRYRSYDYRTDTFIGRDGRRYYCNL